MGSDAALRAVALLRSGSDAAPVGASAMGDDELLRRFTGGDLAPEDFDHAAHVRTAWLLLRRRPLGAAIDTLRTGLRLLDDRAGHPEWYNETVTVAYALLMRSRIDDGPAGEGYEGFLVRCPELAQPHPAALAAWYGEGELEGERARRGFLMPRRVRTDRPAEGADRAE